MSLTFALQALLERHESYMAEAEQERTRMTASIEKLEQDKRDLEAANTRMIEQNRDLLDQLEGLNSSVAESDIHIKSLSATLTSAQYEVRRLTVLASRTTQLEAQLAALESEQARLQHELDDTIEEERSAVSRWRQAECTLRDLRDQVERIETESKEERERHVELLGRIERRKAVESELDVDAHGLNGRSNAKSGPNTAPVVSHFVRDILQDNANLQLGIVELREMLHSSNEEVQNLRAQIVVHQPLDLEANDPATPLSEELDVRDPSRRASQELHVHHHYHPAPESSIPKRLPSYRRPRKKRGLLPVGVMTPTSGSQTPRTLGPYRDQSPSASATATLLSQTSVSIPPHSTHNRWSMQSNATGASVMSSIPSSPQSTGRRTSSIFDRIDYGLDSSRPTSPESNGMTSPAFDARHQKGASISSSTSLSGPAVFQTPQSPATLQPGSSVLPGISTPIPVRHHQARQILESGPELALSPPVEPTIPEELEDESIEPQPSQTDSQVDMDPTPISPPEDFFLPTRPSLRRATSHESLFSISGMDIHTLRDRPSQALLAVSSSKPVVHTTNVTASSSQCPSIRSSQSSSQTLLSGFASPKNADPGPPETRPGLTQRVGGWVWGKWGVAPMASTGNLRAQAALNQISAEASRPVGINQKGAIPGLRPPKRTPSVIHTKVLDAGALQESLAE